MAAPTVPVYEGGDATFPDDEFVTGPIFIVKDQGWDGAANTLPALCWKGAGYFFYIYYDSFFHQVIGRPAFGIGPQDPLEGQLAVGDDHSLNWYAQGKWYGKQGMQVFAITGSGPPQDAVEGQIAAGFNGLFWFVDGNWYGFQPDASSRPYPF